MKTPLPLLILLPFLLVSCEDKNNSSETGKSETIAWIEKTMRQHYYWYEEIPEESNLNFNAGEEDFFYSMLSLKDGKDGDGGSHYYYSYITELNNTKSRSISDVDNSYGFDYMFCSFGEKIDKINAIVLYVALDSESPARKAGLKRGDCIFAKNGVDLTRSNYTSLLSGEAIEMSVVRWEKNEQGKVEASIKTIAIDAARTIEDNPVYYYDVIPYDGKKVGYLVYNHFTDGITDNGKEYNELLRTVSGDFKKQGFDDLVLDLRYNNGGLLSCAQILCSILAPEAILNSSTAIGYLEYNDKKKDDFKITPTILGTGTNLNLSKLYVLTSSSTASASEVIINCLRPYMEVVVIGDKTEGKNVGSVTFTNDSKTWEMHPITCKIFNSKGESDYASGFEPNHAVAEVVRPTDKVPGVSITVDLENFRDFGDTDESLLNAALQLISTGKYTPLSTQARSATTYGAPTIIMNSLDRKATSVIIDTVE